MPTVSCLSIANAILSLVPTPSVPLTRTGSFSPRAARLNMPPKEPMFPIEPVRAVEATWDLIRRTTS